MGVSLEKVRQQSIFKVQELTNRIRTDLIGKIEPNRLDKAIERALAQEILGDLERSVSSTRQCVMYGFDDEKVTLEFAELRRKIETVEAYIDQYNERRELSLKASQTVEE